MFCVYEETFPDANGIVINFMARLGHRHACNVRLVSSLSPSHCQSSRQGGRQSLAAVPGHPAQTNSTSPLPIKSGASGQREPRSLMAVSGRPPRDSSTPLPHKVNCVYDRCRSYGCHIANMACSNNLRMRRRVLVLGILHAERHSFRSADASESAGCVARCFMCPQRAV